MLRKQQIIVASIYATVSKDYRFKHIAGKSITDKLPYPPPNQYYRTPYLVQDVAQHDLLEVPGRCCGCLQSDRYLVNIFFSYLNKNLCPIEQGFTVT